MTIIIGGFVTANHPMPVVRELIKRGLGDLTVIGSATAGLEIDLLIGAGCVRKLVAPYVGAELYAPIGNCFRAAAERKEIEIWECSEYILYAGLRPGPWARSSWPGAGASAPASRS
jgi:glutaconate CoA-transferase subunit A